MMTEIDIFCRKHIFATLNDVGHLLFFFIIFLHQAGRERSWL